LRFASFPQERFLLRIFRNNNMRPILLQGHERSITFIKYNREGDLIFSCSKDKNPTVWYADNGERLGTYNGHGGAVWTCDVDDDTRRLATGSADRTVRLWEVESGREIFKWEFPASVRVVSFSEGDRLLLVVVESMKGVAPKIEIFSMTELSTEPVLTIELQSKSVSADWGLLNQEIFVGCDDGSVYVYDGETGELKRTQTAHKGPIRNIALSHDKMFFVTSSADRTAKLWDAKTLEVLKTYHTDKPVNAGAISPIFEHVMLGGGQEAADVTTTATRLGKFQVRFFHKVFEEELGGVSGHFGPINCLEFSPDGKSFASGGEDGYVRLHHFDKSYFTQAEMMRAVESVQQEAAAADATPRETAAGSGRKGKRPAAAPADD